MNASDIWCSIMDKVTLTKSISLEVEIGDRVFRQAGNNNFYMLEHASAQFISKLREGKISYDAYVEKTSKLVPFYPLDISTLVQPTFLP